MAPTSKVGDRDESIAVGRVGPARGVKGDLFVQPWTDRPEERFAAGSVLRTEPATVGPLTVERMSNASGKVVIHFTGVENREAAEALRGTRLLIRAADRPAITDPDEFYDTDLIGLAAHTTDGRELGPVRDVLHAGGAVYLVLDVDTTERLVPFVSTIVPTVDIARGFVEIDPPEGLFEL